MQSATFLFNLAGARTITCESRWKSKINMSSGLAGKQQFVGSRAERYEGWGKYSRFYEGNPQAIDRFILRRTYPFGLNMASLVWPVLLYLRPTRSSSSYGPTVIVSGEAARRRAGMTKAKKWDWSTNQLGCAHTFLRSAMQLYAGRELKSEKKLVMSGDSPASLSHPSLAVRYSYALEFQWSVAPKILNTKWEGRTRKLVRKSKSRRRPAALFATYGVGS